MYRTNYGSCTARSSENPRSSAVEALMEKERQDETQFTTKIDGFLLSFTPTLEC
jgi:hypothetical protein